MKQLQKLTTWIATSLTAFGLTLTVVGAPVISASAADPTPQETACETLKALGKPCDTAAESGILLTMKSIINVLTLIIGIGSVIMLTISGFRFVISGGEASAVKSARSGIIYALIGVAVVIVGQVIVAFVINKLQ